MKKNSILKSYKKLQAKKGFKITSWPIIDTNRNKPFGIKIKYPGALMGKSGSLKKSSFKRTPSDLQKRIKEADNKFSNFIINRDKRCLRCSSTEFNTCSHFYGRANYAVRYDPDNGVDFCQPCHDIMESKKEGEYKYFMIALIGEDRFQVLEHKSKLRISKEGSLILANNLLKRVETNKDIQY